MSIYYFGWGLIWESYLEANSFVKDVYGTIRKTGSQIYYPISNQTQRIIANPRALSRTFQQEFKETHSILAEGFGIIGQKINAIHGGIEQFGAAFTYGMSLLIHQLEARTLFLRNILQQLDIIHQTLKSPTLIQARESYIIGKEWLQKGLLTKALKSFLEAEEKNQTDFLTHHALGHLYLYGKNLTNHLINLPKAERHFRDAAQYARLEIDHLLEARKFCGEAYLHASIACYIQADERYRTRNTGQVEYFLQEAANLAKQATEVYPQMAEGFYQYAKICALLGEVQSAIQSLEVAIKMDRNYCLKVDVDRDFDGIFSHVLGLFKKFHQQTKEDAKKSMSELSHVVNDYVFLTVKAQMIKEQIERVLKEAENLYQDGTYFNYLEVLKNSTQAKDLIKTVPPFESLVVLEGHTEWVSSVSFSPNGQYLASGSRDGTIQLWEISSQKKLATLYGHTEGVSSVSFSPDGHYLVSGSLDKTVQVWEFPSGRILATLKGHTNWISSVSFSPDGRYLASGSWDGTIRLWQAPSGRKLSSLQGHTKGVSSIVFSPDGLYLASGSWDGTVRLWEVPMGKEVVVLRGHLLDVSSVSFSPDGLYLASGSWDCTVKIWEASSGRVLETLPGHTGAILAVSFSPDALYLATGNWDHTIRIWDFTSMREQAVLPGHKDKVLCISFSPDGIHLVSGSSDKTVRLWGRQIIPPFKVKPPVASSTLTAEADNSPTLDTLNKQIQHSSKPTTIALDRQIYYISKPAQ